MSRFSDRRVHDHVVLDEIELYGDLMIAASASEGPLTQAQIDAVLGLGGRISGAHTRAGPRRRGLRSAPGVRLPGTPP
ncbi:hypothetical protein [Streptomyces sp. SID3343]|uniref:hypothetical protein n=1 Tax=Streptomyces sp. SID3343 TaxID=2690260 RepID=UPI0013C0577A|nr:hypothetical protein [Streptomyces sp. SID3343]MYW06452.1 hypothetical protein [Streptomyces sp. SID3343]